MKRRIAAIATLAVLLLCGVVWARMTTVVVGQGVSTALPDPTDQIGTGGIVRSVGATDTALFGHDFGGGTYTLTIIGNIATFNGATSSTTPFANSAGTGKVGVGDIISYGSSVFAVIKGLSMDSTGVKAYVWAPALTTSAVDSTSVTEATADDTFHVWRAYTSLANAIASTENTNSGYTGDSARNLTDADVLKSMYLACYADASHAAINLNGGFTTSSSYKLVIFTPYLSNMVGYSQRHNGTISSGFTIAASSGDAFNPHNHYLDVVGLVVTNSNGYGIHISSSYSNILIDSCVVKATSEGVMAESSGTITLRNSIAYGGTRGIYGAGNVIAVQNCTANGSSQGIRSSGTNTTVTNSVAAGPNGASFYGTFNAASNYNASIDTTNTGGANDAINQTFTFGGSDDYRIAAADTGAKDTGTDLSGTFTNDITGYTRPYNSTWDKGAYEYRP